MSPSVHYPEPHSKDRHGDVGEAETVGFFFLDNQPSILFSEFQVSVRHNLKKARQAVS